MALVDLLRHWNIIPDAVVGHSSGEIAAAYCKGAIDREGALLISYHRGRLSSDIRGFAPDLAGAMLVTGLGPEAVQIYISNVTDGTAVVACINSPSSTTLSGDAQAIDTLHKILSEDGHFARRLKIDTAYHSHHMEVIAESYLSSLASVQILQGDDQGVKMFSSVSGKLVNSSELGPSYWVANMLSPVNFFGAVESLFSHSDVKLKRKSTKPYVEFLVEVGPHSALQGPIMQILRSNPQKFESLTYASILERGANACTSALDAAGRLFQRGFPVNISAVNTDKDVAGNDGFLVDLPAYAWNRNAKYWY